MDLDNGKTTNGSLTFKVSTQHIVSFISSLEEKNAAGFSASNLWFSGRTSAASSNGSLLFRSHRFTWTPTSIWRTRYCGQLSKSDNLNSWFVLSRLSPSEAVYTSTFVLLFLFASDPRLVFRGSKVFQIMLFLRALNPFPWISETCDEGVSLPSIRAYNYTNAVLFCRCMTFKH